MLRIFLAFLLLCAWVHVLSAASCGLLTAKDHLSTDSIIEWEITDAPPAWLSYDVTKTPSAQITAPDGTIIKRQAFLYQKHQANPMDKSGSGLKGIGPQVLRIRHQARQAGKYTIQCFAPDGKRFASQQFTISAGQKPIGPVQRSQRNPRLLSFANQETFIPIGCNISWANGPDRLGNFKHYLQQLHKQGGNHIRLWMCSWFGHLESSDPDVYRLDHAALIDGVLAEARRLGIYVTLVLDNHHDLVHGKAFPYGDNATQRIQNFLGMPLNQQYQRRLRYVVARYACDDQILAWELFNELDEALYHQTLPENMLNMQLICGQWIHAAAAFLKQIDPDKRLVTSSLSWQTWSEVEGADAFDVIHVHEYVPQFKDIHPLHFDGILPLQTHLQRLAMYKRPFRFAEVGHNGTNEHNPAHELDPGGYFLRQQAWAGFMLGGYGSGMNWWWDTYIEKEDLWQVYQPLHKAIAHLDWQDQHLLPLTLNQGGSLRVMGWRSDSQAIIWPQIRANTWHALTVKNQPPHVYGKQGFRLGQFLPNTEYHVTWMSMEDGNEHQHTIQNSNQDGQLLFRCPTGHKLMVVLIRKR